VLVFHILLRLLALLDKQSLPAFIRKNQRLGTQVDPTTLSTDQAKSLKESSSLEVPEQNSTMDWPR
jgi:hypothetical protein